MATSQDFTLDSVRTVLLSEVKHLSAILRELVELRNGPERDDYGTLRPTKYAFDAASGLLLNAAVASAVERHQIPHGCVSTDSRGGVRVEWVRDHASVHLAVPDDDRGPAYVYHEIGGAAMLPRTRRPSGLPVGCERLTENRCSYLAGASWTRYFVPQSSIEQSRRKTGSTEPRRACCPPRF